MRYIVVAIVGALVFTTLSSCSFTRRTLRGNGDMVEIERNVRGYSRVSNSGSAQVTVRQNGEQGVTIIVDENLADYVKTEVRGDTLYLGWKTLGMLQNLRSSRRLEFIVNMDDVKGLATSGSGDIEAKAIEGHRIELGTSGSGSIMIDALACVELDAGLSGSGDIDVKGQAERQKVRISGSGTYDGSSLRSDRAKINTSGSGKARVWVRDDLEAHTSGSGSIEYRGTPRVDSHSSGSGHVRNIGHD